MNIGDSNMALNATGFRFAPPSTLALRYPASRGKADGVRRARGAAA